MGVFMVRSFAITTPSPSLRLKVPGQGEHAFTVTNALGRPVRVRAQVVPEGQTRGEWLDIAESTERDLPPDGTLQFTVKVALPPAAPEGQYAFHLVVVDVANPDEMFSTGPTVAFQLVRPPPPKKKPLPKWPFLVGAAVLALLILVGVLVGTRDKKEEEPAIGGSGVTEPTAPTEPVRLGFDGSTAYVDLGNPRTLAFSGDVTVEAWILPRATDGLRNIVAHGYTFTPHGEFSFRIFNGQYQVGSWDGNGYGAGAPVPPEDVGQWVHLAGVYDGAQWHLYRNGELLNSAPAIRGIFPVNASWAIGARGGGVERFFKGEIREVRLWRVVRTPEEIKAGMLQPPAQDAPGLVGSWPLDEGEGAITQDRGRLKNHGVLRDTVWVNPNP
jgi:hypothetical protein